MMQIIRIIGSILRLIRIFKGSEPRLAKLKIIHEPAHPNPNKIKNNIHIKKEQIR